MGRKHRRQPMESRPAPVSHQRTEVHPDGEWSVRHVTGSAATKPYRCPGCDQLIPPATPHVVAWPADLPDGLEDRRHWHTACWSARLRRGPKAGR
jgi:hypothetical protein